ncbi:MAG: putative transposase [Psychromonas sp.]
MLNVYRSGFYAWLKEPQSDAEKDNVRLLVQMKASYVQSGAVYGSPRITHALRRSGGTCSENRVAKWLKQANLSANIGYKRRYFKPSTPHIAADNYLQ